MPELGEIYRLLQANEFERALAALSNIVPETPVERAKVHAWRGQALRALGRANEGADELIHAIRIIKQSGNPDDLPSLRALHADLARSAASLQLAAQAKARDTNIIARADEHLDVEGLIRKAQALIEHELPQDAIHVSKLALCLATEPRHSVLALLVLARCDGPEHLHSAHQIADDASDENLLTAVAQAAKLLRVRLRPPSFG